MRALEWERLAVLIVKSRDLRIDRRRPMVRRVSLTCVHASRYKTVLLIKRVGREGSRAVLQHSRTIVDVSE